MKRTYTTLTASFAVGISLVVILVSQAEVQGQAVPVDLRPWTAESYPAVPGFGSAVWTVAEDGLSVFQSVNGQPTFFYSDFSTFNTDLQASIVVMSAGDNDYIGFALGFQPGDSSNPNAEYLLVDWKRDTQFYDFGSPSDTPGKTAYRGLSVSRVFGIPTADEFWSHWNWDHPSSDLGNGLRELARGSNLGDTGWEFDREYEFRFEFSPDSLRVYVDGVLEIDLMDNFEDGRFAFYNFSQQEVRYSCSTVTARLYLPLVMHPSPRPPGLTPTPGP